MEVYDVNILIQERNRQKNKVKKTIKTIIIVIVSLIAAAGIGFGIMKGVQFFKEKKAEDERIAQEQAAKEEEERLKAEEAAKILPPTITTENPGTGTLITITEASANSAYKDSKGKEHGADNAFDGKKNKYWAENASGAGAGQEITGKFDSATVLYVAVNTGNQEDKKEFKKYNRSKTLTVKTGSQSFTVDLEDTSDTQYIVFDKPIEGATDIIVTLGEVYEGSKNNDVTSISEIAVYGN